MTRDPAADDPEVYGGAWPLVAQWRQLKARHPVRGRSLSWLTDYEGLLVMELAMLEEHELTLPPAKQPVKGQARWDHTRWRWKALYRTQVAIRRRKLLRWLRRLLTLGIWWNEDVCPGPAPGLASLQCGLRAAANRQQAPGKRLAAGCSRCLQNPFPAMVARAIINAVYGFFQSFPPESWRVRPRPGPAARDRASLSRRRSQRG